MFTIKLFIFDFDQFSSCLLTIGLSFQKIGGLKSFIKVSKFDKERKYNL